MSLQRDDVSYFEGNKYVTEITPRDFEEYATWKLKKKECSAILFYAPWCPHCKSVKTVWENLGKTAVFMDILAFNCEKYSEHLMSIKEDMPELVKGFPTIIFYKNGSPVESYADDRTDSKLLKASMRVCQGSR